MDRSVAMRAQGDSSASEVQCLNCSGYGLYMSDFRTTAGRNAGVTEGDRTGRRTAAVEATSVEEGVAAAIKLAVDAAVGPNRGSSSTPPAAATKILPHAE